VPEVEEGFSSNPAVQNMYLTAMALVVLGFWSVTYKPV
jgi:hypothetical protein